MGEKLSKALDAVARAEKKVADADAEARGLEEARGIIAADEERRAAEAHAAAVEAVHRELAESSAEFVVARDEALELLQAYHEIASSGLAIYDRLVGLKSREALLIGSDVSEGHFELPQTGTQEMGANPRYREIALKMGVPLTGANAFGDGSKP